MTNINLLQDDLKNTRNEFIYPYLIKKIEDFFEEDGKIVDAKMCLHYTNIAGEFIDALRSVDPVDSDALALMVRGYSRTSQRFYSEPLVIARTRAVALLKENVPFHAGDAYWLSEDDARSLNCYLSQMMKPCFWEFSNIPLRNLAGLVTAEEDFRPEDLAEVVFQSGFLNDFLVSKESEEKKVSTWKVDLLFANCAGLPTHEKSSVYDGRMRFILDKKLAAIDALRYIQHTSEIFDG